MEVIGKGDGYVGAVWVAQRIPDGYISGHANQARIRKFPRDDPENCKYSKDVVSFAREKGFYNGADEDFSFSDVYNPVTFSGARGCDVWRTVVCYIISRVVCGASSVVILPVWRSTRITLWDTTLPTVCHCTSSQQRS